MRRYLHTLRLFWSASLAAEMEYRAHFLFATGFALGNMAGTIFTLSLLTRGGEAMTAGGWTFQQGLLVVGFFTLMTGFSESVLEANLNRFVRYVREGTLDFVLLKPIDSQFHLSTRHFSPWGLPNVLLGLGLIVYAGRGEGFTAWDYLAGVAPLLIGFVILYSLWFMLSTTSIWFVKIYNVTYVLSGLLDAGRFPIAAYPYAYRLFFTFVVPVAFLTTAPVQIMMGDNPWARLGWATLTAIITFTAARLWWRFAQKYYTSASS